MRNATVTGPHSTRVSSWNGTNVTLLNAIASSLCTDVAELYPATVLSVRTEYRTSLATRVSIQTIQPPTSTTTSDVNVDTALPASSITSAQASGLTAAVMIVFLILLCGLWLLVRRRRAVQGETLLTQPGNQRYHPIQHMAPTAYVAVEQQELEQPLERADETPPLPDDAEMQILSLYQSSRNNSTNQLPMHISNGSVFHKWSLETPVVQSLGPPSVEAGRCHSPQASVLLPEPVRWPSMPDWVSPTPSAEEVAEIPASVLHGLEETYNTLWSYHSPHPPSQLPDTLASSPTDSTATYLPASAFSSSSSGGEDYRVGDCRRATLPSRTPVCVARSSKGRFSR